MSNLIRNEIKTDVALQINSDNPVIFIAKLIEACNQHKTNASNNTKIIKRDTKSKHKLINKVKYSETCNYKGVLKQINSEYDNRYYICLCDEDKEGDFCELDVSFRESIEFKIENFLTSDKFNLLDQEKTILLLIQILELPVSNLTIKNILKINNLKQLDLQANNRNLYVFFDKFLLKIYNYIEELHKYSKFVRKNEYLNFKEILSLEAIEIFVIETLSKTFSNIKFEESFINSLSTQYQVIPTSSFKIIEQKINNSLNIISIPNPEIDSSISLRNLNTIKFEIENKQEVYIQVINIASQMFKDLT